MFYHCVLPLAAMGIAWMGFVVWEVGGGMGTERLKAQHIYLLSSFTLSELRDS